ncbi:HPF/RaiA family ribosome-associated protein [Kribbella sp. NPDC020789]
MREATAAVQVTARGDVPLVYVDYAMRRVRHVVGRAGERIGTTHVVLALAANPAHEHPAEVEIEASTDGTPIHAHAAAGTLTEAVDEATARLRRQLADRHERRLTRRRPQPQPAPPENRDHPRAP